MKKMITLYTKAVWIFERRTHILRLFPLDIFVEARKPKPTEELIVSFQDRLSFLPGDLTHPPEDLHKH